MIEFDEDTDEEWEGYDGQCCACDRWGQVDDLGLCEECRTKFERDLVRLRDWDYSAWAFGLSDEGREVLYREVIAQHGKKLELIAPPDGTQRKRTGTSGTPAARHRGQQRIP